jgi:hypothetical protein
MVAILDFKRGKQLYDIVFNEGDKSWYINLKNLGLIKLEDDEIIAKAETQEELELLIPEYFL